LLELGHGGIERPEHGRDERAPGPGDVAAVGAGELLDDAGGAWEEPADSNGDRQQIQSSEGSTGTPGRERATAQRFRSTSLPISRERRCGARRLHGLVGWC